MVEEAEIQEEEAAFEEPTEEKTPEEEIEKPEEEKSETKSRRSEIAQKKHWRDKAQKESSKVKTLEAELQTLRDAVKKPTDEQEAKAQDYIREQARGVFKELQLEKAKEEEKELEQFEAQVESILEDNPDVSEEELLDIVEELEVTPAVALKVLKRTSKETKEKKPNMPKAKRASAEESKEAPDDSKKNIWQIAAEEAKKFANK